MPENLFEYLYLEFVKSKPPAMSIEHFVRFCKKRMAAENVRGLQQGAGGSAGLVFADNSIKLLGDNPQTVAESGLHGLSVGFTQQPQRFDRPATIEAPAVPFAGQ
jgi:hypothetical protein